MSSKFEVLVQKNGRIEWLPVPGCINHNEARSQGEAMYAGKIIQTRYLGVDNTSSSSDETSDSDSASGGFALLVVGIGVLLLISLWPIILVGGLSYLGYKLYKKYA